MVAARSVQQARRVLDIEIAALRRVRRRLGPSFLQAVRLMQQRLENGGKIIVTGIGKSGHIGHKIASTLASTGTTSVTLDPVDAVHGDLGVVARKDLILVLSYSGNTDELLRVVPLIKRQGVPILAMTGNPRSNLARQSDVVLDVSVEQEACPLNLAPTSSTTAMLAMGDALAMVLLQSRGFRREDFPVQDIMRPRKSIPICTGKTSVARALSQITAKRCGAALVVDGKGKLAGIYTHGDFVRGFQKDPGIGKRPLAAVMTRRPISISSGSLAAKALHIFETHRIEDLVVVDAAHRPVGLVDSQDLTRFRLL
ncbi:KpsF/GutQ family sugar-phosphate isomerase [bacterium]|nr:KpsF/GutQ family sugar-phosphate isomerase [bacterium]